MFVKYSRNKQNSNYLCHLTRSQMGGGGTVGQDLHIKILGIFLKT